jgi:two-component system LytT family response regulator
VNGPIRAVIVDDEPLARDLVRQMLSSDPEIVVVGDCLGADAPALIERTAPHLLFLDVQMPEVDGFQVLEALSPAALPATIFVTAYDHYAVRAFDVHAIDYLRKPLEDARFALAVARAKERIRGADRGATERIQALLEEREQTRASAPVDRFLVRARGRVVVVRAAEIDWIEAADYYATLHAGGESHLVRQTMTELEERLDPGRFVRVHRGAIVNVDRVREVQAHFRGDCALVLEDGTRVKLSRTRRGDFERVFAGPRAR